MNSFHALRIYNDNSLIQQFYSLIDGILFFHDKKTILFIEPVFRKIPISQIINMPLFYNYIRNTFNIHIFDLDQAQVNIQAISGEENITNKFLQNGKIVIPKNSFVDTLTIVYTINNVIINTNHNVNEDFISTLNVSFTQNQNQNQYRKKWIDTILNNIVLIPAIQELKYSTTYVNCLHIYLKDSYLKKIASTHNMNLSNAKTLIENNYINAIHQYFKKYDTIVVLSSCKNNRIIEFLEKEYYAYELSDVLDKENQTIIDLHRSKLCNNIFIGNQDSSFSSYIKLINNVNSILL